MNTAAMILKKIDLLSFISHSSTHGASLRMTVSNDGSQAGYISFPSCGNWINRPMAQTSRRASSGSMLRSLFGR